MHALLQAQRKVLKEEDFGPKDFVQMIAKSLQARCCPARLVLLHTSPAAGPSSASPRLIHLFHTASASAAASSSSSLLRPWVFELRRIFKHYVTSGSGNAGAREMSPVQFLRFCKDAGLCKGVDKDIRGSGKDIRTRIAQAPHTSASATAHLRHHGHHLRLEGASSTITITTASTTPETMHHHPSARAAVNRRGVAPLPARQHAEPASASQQGQ